MAENITQPTADDVLAQNLPLSESCKVFSRTTHDSVDNLVMSMQPFASKENYGKFLQAQHEFHETIKPVYYDSVLNEQIPDLSTLSRAEAVLSDMQDLLVTPANIDVARPVLNPQDKSTIGWLYCVEGSNVGAAILYKEAGKIDLNDDNGAKHLAAHPDGRMPNWRNFKTKLDNLSLTDDEKRQVLQGVEDAFSYFKQMLRAVYQA